MATKTGPSLSDIKEARSRLQGVARETPVYGSETLSRQVGRPVSLKAENLQRTGSFKVRGAVNKLATLSEGERRAGVVAASAGNHGQALAWAAREAGVKATVFMPQDAPMAKVEATRSYGAEVEMGGAGLEEAVSAALERVEATGAPVIFDATQWALSKCRDSPGPRICSCVPPAGAGGLRSYGASKARWVNPSGDRPG